MCTTINFSLNILTSNLGQTKLIGQLVHQLDMGMLDLDKDVKPLSRENYNTD